MKKLFIVFSLMLISVPAFSQIFGFGSRAIASIPIADTSNIAWRNRPNTFTQINTVTGFFSFLLASDSVSQAGTGTANGQTGIITITSVNIAAGSTSSATIQNSFVSGTATVVLTLMAGNDYIPITLKALPSSTGFLISFANVGATTYNTNLNIFYFVTHQ